MVFDFIVFILLNFFLFQLHQFHWKIPQVIVLTKSFHWPPLLPHLAGNHISMSFLKGSLNSSHFLLSIHPTRVSFEYKFRLFSFLNISLDIIKLFNTNTSFPTSCYFPTIFSLKCSSPPEHSTSSLPTTEFTVTPAIEGAA